MHYKFHVHLTAEEGEYLKARADEMGKSYKEIAQRALRLYRAVDARVKRGERIFFIDVEGKRTELEML